MGLKIFFDTEFIEDGHTIDLISIGAVREDGTEFYAESGEADLSKANPWVREHVLPYLGRWDGQDNLLPPLSRHVIAERFLAFANEKGRPEFWAYYADYDWVALCQLYGRMIDLPEGWPKFCMDLKQLAVSLGDPRLPKQTHMEHHALADALWNRDIYLWLHAPKESV
jgi:hypothetical protein